MMLPLVSGVTSKRLTNTLVRCVGLLMMLALSIALRLSARLLMVARLCLLVAVGRMEFLRRRLDSA
jgi:uncharacterized membrane protein YqgA involved in biofilm formation